MSIPEQNVFAKIEMDIPDFQPPPWPSAFNEAPKWAVEREEILTSK